MARNAASKVYIRKLYFKIAFLLTILLLLNSISMATSKKYTISKRTGGGYTLKLHITERSLMPITAEGFFPKREKYYFIEIIGEGEDWSYKAQNGYFYPLEAIKSAKRHWDIGYAWVNADRTYLYLNLYWVDGPDGLKRSDISGKYAIKTE